MIKFYLCTGTMGMFHPYILRKHKTEYDVMVREFFKWFVDNVPEQICKLNVAIPKQFKGAIKAAKRANMKSEGVDRMSYLSKSGPCDRMLLGITRREMNK
jgi:RimJ/RimL family protein N-acetyltransferase